MGCDIHMILEKKVDGKWLGLHDFPYTSEGGWRARARNYDRFAMIAGVRGEGPDPKGVPDDASDLAKYVVDHWGGDGHSHTWMPLKDAVPLWLATDRGSRDEYAAKYPATYFFEVDNDVDDHRLVIFFDN